MVLRIALAAGLAIFALDIARADDAPPANVAKPKKVSPTPTSDQAEVPERQDAAKERFAVPEGGVNELLAFIKQTMKSKPLSRQGIHEWRTKGFAAMRQAAEKIKQIATDADKNLAGYAEVDGQLLYFRANAAQQATAQERNALIADLKAYFADNPQPSRYAIRAARQLSSALEVAQDIPAAVALNRELGARLANSSDRATAIDGLRMEGTARLRELPGNTMEITGTEFDGSKFDWSAYRGKVVLVDFWATWCGPGIRELPNVKKNYEWYHDKGFDVVGISLDNSRKQIEDFVAKEQLPWASIYEGGGWNTPMALFYGITSMPRAILVDQEGKVLSMQTRGPTLGKLLAELLGPAESADSEDTTAANPASEKSD